LIAHRLYRRLPTLIFWILVVCLPIAGYLLFQVAIAKYSRGDYFYLETGQLSFEFPKSWWASTYEHKNESGTIYYVTAYPMTSRETWVSVIFVTYDEKITESYLEKYDFSNMSEALIFEINRTYWDIKKSNEDATLHFLRNSTILISGSEAILITIKIVDGYTDKEGNVHNLTATFVSWIHETSAGAKIYYIIFFGVEEEWSKDQAQKAFNHMLKTVKVSDRSV